MKKTRSRPPQQITYGAELGRKSIHLTSILIPIVGAFTPWDYAVVILALMAAFSFLVDVARSRRGFPGDLLRQYCDFMIREHERKGRNGSIPLSGATWLLASATLTYLLFPTAIATAALAMLILCDTAAALIGRRFGTIRFGPKKKSLEGSLAFFVVGVMIALVTPGLPLVAGLVGALVATIAEASPWELDDNFSVPLSSGVAMAIVWSLLG